MEISATTSFADPPRPDVVVVPGGSGQAALMKHPLLLDHPRACAHTAGRRASVCTGALLLAQAGLLQMEYGPQPPLRAGSPGAAPGELVESLRQRARAYG